MREMKDSGVAWIGEIPEEWVCCKQKYAMKLINGRAYSDSEFEKDGKYKILRVGNLFSNPVWYTSNLELPEDKYCSSGDLLYSWSMSYAPVFWYGEKVIYHYHIWKVNLNDKIQKKFAYYYLVALTDALKAEIHETTMGFITMGVMNNSYIAIPNIAEQQTIATYLDQKCTQIDALITNQQKQIEKLKAYKQSLITETVTKGLNPDVPMKDSGVEWIGEIPEDWEIVRIKNICQFNPSSKKSFSDDDIVSYAPMECVRTGLLVHKEIAIKNVSSGLTYFEENDIIMAKVTPCFENGNIAIATGLTKGMAFGSSELFVFRANESIKFFLFYFLQNNIFKKFSISTMTGTGGLKRVSSNFVNNYSFALPPIEERNKIVFYLDKKCTQIDSLIAIKQRKIEKLQQYKKSVIYEYVTGKKEVK